MSKTNTPQWIIGVLDNLNVEDFISCIELEPAIWDSTKPEYSNNVETEKSWKNVCIKVDPEFDSRPAIEKNKLGKSLHRRWKSLRDCYTRERKKQKANKSGSAASVRKPYIYFEQLRFLEPVQCTTESNVEMEENEEHMNNDEDEQVVITYPELQYPQPSRGKKRKDNDDQLMDVLKKKMASKSNTAKPTEDADSMFLSSLVPELKKIPESHKLYVKSQIVNTILGIQSALNIAAIPATPGSPYHHNIANTQIYPQHSTPNYEMPPTSNYSQAYNPIMNRAFQQPTPTFTPATYHTLEPVAQTKNITPNICQASPSISTETTTAVKSTSPFSKERNHTEMSNDSEDFPFWKSV